MGVKSDIRNQSKAPTLPLVPAVASDTRTVWMPKSSNPAAPKPPENEVETELS